MNNKNNKEKQNNINKNENFIYIRTYIIPFLLLIIALAIFYTNWHISYNNMIICIAYLYLWCIAPSIAIIVYAHLFLTENQLNKKKLHKLLLKAINNIFNVLHLTKKKLNKKKLNKRLLYKKKLHTLKRLKATNNIVNVFLIWTPLYNLILYKVFIPLFSYKDHSHWQLSLTEKTSHSVFTLTFIIASLIISLLSKLCIYKINNKKLINDSKNKHAWNILCINIIAIFTLVEIIILMAVYGFLYLKFIDKNHNLTVFRWIFIILTFIISYLIYSTINNKIYLETSWKEYKLIIIPLITAIMSVLFSN